jgi:hypothetical protein
LLLLLLLLETPVVFFVFLLAISLGLIALNKERVSKCSASPGCMCDCSGQITYE